MSRPSLFETLIAEHNHGLAGELAMLSGDGQAEHRALLRLRKNVGQRDALSAATIREFLRLYVVEIKAEQAYALHRIREYEQPSAGRPPLSFAHNLILVAALAEWNNPAAAARKLGAPITQAGVRKARARAAKIASDFLSLIGAAGEDHDAFFERRILEMRKCLVAAESRQRLDANTRAHPSARRFYAATTAHDQREPASAADRSRFENKTEAALAGAPRP